MFHSWYKTSEKSTYLNSAECISVTGNDGQKIFEEMKPLQSEDK